MRKVRAKRKVVFTPAEVARERKALIAERLGILPASVDEYGYQYDAAEAVAALQKNPPEKPASK